MYSIERFVSKPLQGNEGPLRTLENAFLPHLAVAHEIPYVNFGLLCNRKKQDCEVDTTVHIVDLDVLNDSLMGRIKTIKKIQETLLSGLSEKLQARANPIFYRHQKPWLDKCFPHLNPFISEAHGSFGLYDIGIEIEESRAQARIRRKLYDWSTTSGRTLSSYLLGEEAGDRIVNLLKEKAGNYFPSMRLRFSDERAINPFGNGLDSEPDYSPTNRWWRLLKRNHRQSIRKEINSNEDFAVYRGEIHQARAVKELKELYSEPKLSPLMHKRVVRFDGCNDDSYMKAVQSFYKADDGSWNCIPTVDVNNNNNKDSSYC